MKIFDTLEFLKRKWDEYGIDFDWDTNQEGTNIRFRIKDNEAVLHLDKDDKFSGIKLDWKKIEDDEIREKFQQMIGLVDKCNNRITEGEMDNYGCCSDGSMEPWGGICVAGVGLTEDGETHIQEFLRGTDEDVLLSDNDEIYRLARNVIRTLPKNGSLQDVYMSNFGKSVTFGPNAGDIAFDCITVEESGWSVTVIINLSAEEFNDVESWLLTNSDGTADINDFLMDVVNHKISQHATDNKMSLVTKSHLSTILSSAIVMVGMDYQYQSIREELGEPKIPGKYSDFTKIYNKHFKDASIEKRRKYMKMSLV